MFNLIKTIIKKLYVIALMYFIIQYALFITPIMFGHNERRAELVKETKETFATEVERDFNKLLKEQAQTKTMDIGYKIVDEQYVKGHFHHVGFKVEHDTFSLCIKCHGDVPHDKAKAIRAFLNMHAFYLGCEVCHIKPKEGRSEWVFKWYDKKTGTVIPSPVPLMVTSAEKYGNYGAKISPGFMDGDKFRFLNSNKEMAFVDEYLKTKDRLS